MNMSAKEKAEMTYRDIKKRQKARQEGQKQADSFKFERVEKANKKRRNASKSIYRGKDY